MSGEWARGLKGRVVTDEEIAFSEVQDDESRDRLVQNLKDHGLEFAVNA